MTIDVAPLSVLFIGGTGTISASSVRLAAESGMTVSVLNRGRNAVGRALPDSVESLVGDAASPSSVAAAVGDRSFDVVVNFLTFTAEQAEDAVQVFDGRTSHYIHISTASLYGKPVLQVPITESTQLHNRFVAYSRAKLDAEAVFAAAFARAGFPVTIVRPSHTYDDANPPLPGGWTVFDRLARGADIVVPGDGTSLWTLTHADDFAVGLVGLFGNARAIGEAFHITSDDVYTWDQIYDIVGAALGVDVQRVHIPSDLIGVGAPDWFWSELIRGDLAHSAIFDNSKIRRFVPAFAPSRTFSRSALRMTRWREDNPGRAAGDPAVEAVLDRLVEAYRGAEKIFASLAPDIT